MKMKENDKTVYSYHCFILPFMCVSKGIELCSVLNNKNPNNIWKSTDLNIRNNSLRVIRCDKISQSKGYYDAYKFFNECGRNLVFRDDDSDNVRCFEIRQDILHGLQYIIGAFSKEYRLPILQISVRYYETDIAVMTIICKNEDYCTIDDCKQINEYGRRLGFPYWPSDDSGGMKCASCLRIENCITGRVLSSDNFLKITDNSENSDISLSYVSTVIRGLLDCNGLGYRFRAKAVSDKKEIQLKTLLDEKMFVASLICDRNYCSALCSDYVQNENNFTDKTMRDLLELIRVDLPGKCSVPNKKEMSEYLNEHLYLTVFSEGNEKLMAVTDQSCVKLVPEPDYEISFFLHSYIPLITIPIVQKYSIIRFQQRIMAFSNHKKKYINSILPREIMTLQQKYVNFQNQFMPESVTAQMEGSFLYRKLRTVLCVKEENDYLSSQIGKLFELASIHQGNILNKGGLSISLIAIVFTVFSYFLTSVELSNIDIHTYGGWPALFVTGLIILFVVLIVMIAFRKNDWR